MMIDYQTTNKNLQDESGQPRRRQIHYTLLDRLPKLPRDRIIIPIIQKKPPVSASSYCPKKVRLTLSKMIYNSETELSRPASLVHEPIGSEVCISLYSTLISVLEGVAVTSPCNGNAGWGGLAIAIYLVKVHKT